MNTNDLRGSGSTLVEVPLLRACLCHLLEQSYREGYLVHARVDTSRLAKALWRVVGEILRGGEGRKDTSSSWWGKAHLGEDFDNLESDTDSEGRESYVLQPPPPLAFTIIFDRKL